MPKIRSEHPVYTMLNNENGFEDFINILGAYSKSHFPIVVFKLPHRVGANITGYSYLFHTTTFTAELLYPTKSEDIAIETIEAKICELANICNPSFIRSLSDKEEVSVLV